MPSPGWYMQRLRSMSLPEIGWRLRHRIRRPWDHLLAPIRSRPVSLRRVLREGASAAAPAGAAVNPGWPAPGEGGAVKDATRDGGAELIARADRIAAHRLDLFDLQDVYLGTEIDWNYEYKARRKTPMRFAPGIDYRDYALTGDCKFVWEVSRHPQWVVLGRAYRLTGRRGYAEAVAEQMASWLRQCPYGYGMNWRSPLELAVRLINWVWTMELIRPSGLPGGQVREAVLASAYRHLWDISRNYSRHSSANNHLIGEATGVFIGSCYFDMFSASRRWRNESRAILERQIIDQTYNDGGNREQAVGYHLFVLEFFVLAGLVARRAREDFSDRYWDYLERMFAFVAALSEGGDNLPMLGDGDDGYVLDLEDSDRRDRSLLAVGAALFGRDDFQRLARGCDRRAAWLLSEESRGRVEHATPSCGGGMLQSRRFPESGLYLLQWGTLDGDRISATFDCGELGMGSIAAHGHADALSITLRVNGQDVLVDPGTYDYFTYPTWRTWFRSTRAHNTIEIDGRSQSEMLGPFLWGGRVQPRCTRWSPTADGGTVAGEYVGLGDVSRAVSHRRSLQLRGQEKRLVLVDDLSGSGPHHSVLAFHFAENWKIEQAGDSRLIASGRAGKLALSLSTKCELEVIEGRGDPIEGWVSRGYHRRVQSPALLVSVNWEGQTSLRTEMVFG